MPNPCPDQLEGAELAAAVAVHCMGWELRHGVWIGPPDEWHGSHNFYRPDRDVAQAMELVDKKNPFKFCIDRDGSCHKLYYVYWYQDGDEVSNEASASGDCLATAICRAALKAALARKQQQLPSGSSPGKTA